MSMAWLCVPMNVHQVYAEPRRTSAEVGMGADLLSHEATFSLDMYGKARIAQHSTARDAGAFAARLQARALVLTHFSNRYSFEGSRPLVSLHA